VNEYCYKINKYANPGGCSFKSFRQIADHCLPIYGFCLLVFRTGRPGIFHICIALYIRSLNFLTMKKKWVIGIMLLCLGQFVVAQSNKQKAEETIRKYWFVLLTKGPNRDQDSTTKAKLQNAHLANIDKLYNEGKIKVAGPFGDGGDWQGIFIFDAASKEEVETLVKQDPAVAAGRLLYTIKPWYTAPIGSFVPGKPQKNL
jgi:uncharacterized protein YciI